MNTINTIKPKELSFDDLLILNEQGFNAFNPDQSPENMLGNVDLVLKQVYSEEELKVIKKMPVKEVMKLFSDINEVTFGTGAEETKN